MGVHERSMKEHLVSSENIGNKMSIEYQEGAGQEGHRQWLNCNAHLLSLNSGEREWVGEWVVLAVPFWLFGVMA